jgi:ABC-type Zn uptake system ZnuABC Zn-binding protein ZnuA
MSREIRQRIVREATPEEKERHRTIREEFERELPELNKWAREAAARHKERVGVGTVFTSEEAVVVDAIDDYAAKHALPGRGAVVREALAHLLGVEIPRR